MVQDLLSTGLLTDLALAQSTLAQSDLEYCHPPPLQLSSGMRGSPCCIQSLSVVHDGVYYTGYLSSGLSSKPSENVSSAAARLEEVPPYPKAMGRVNGLPDNIDDFFRIQVAPICKLHH